MLHLRPLVFLGPAGALALLRSLGFSTFGSVLNESYDTLIDAHDRLRAVLSEVERLSSLPVSQWRDKPLLDALIHNQKHLLCGGFRTTLSERALDIVSMAQVL